jgi:2-polyprenyl-6-methoxyphenol hydroxylase-like FAD-dependent oxidoreductase
MQNDNDFAWGTKMLNITIVGAGQSGLQLGLGLLQNGYRVRLISNRTADDFANGKVMSSQFMFGERCKPSAAAASACD